MALKLSEKEITLRLQRLRNLERFYVELKEKYHKLKEENAMLKEIIKGQSEQIEQLKLQIEELQVMVFGKSKKMQKDDEDDDLSTPKKPRSQPHRDASSYRRPTPTDDEVTDTEYHTLTHCADCGTQLTHTKTIARWVEDVLPLSEWYQALKKTIKHHITTGYCPSITTI